MKVNGIQKPKKKKAMVSLFGLMDQCMKDIGSRTNLRVKDVRYALPLFSFFWQSKYLSRKQIK